MAQSFRRIHDVAPRTSLDRVLFIVAFICGIGGSIVLKIVGAPPLLSAAYSVVVLVAYALLTTTFGRARLDPETVGDNCYYLGFLYTLTSLAYTLYRLATPAEGSTEAETIPTIISGFGIALASTIAGVFLRVLMMQMRVDFVASEREARSALTQATQKLRAELGIALIDIKNYTTESVQHAAERDARLRAATEAFVADGLKIISEAQVNLFRQMEELRARFSASEDVRLKETEKLVLGAVKAMTEAAAASFAELSGKLEPSLNNVSENLDDLSLEIERLKSRSAALTKSIAETATTAFSEASTTLGSALHQVIGDFSGISGEVNTFRATLAANAGEIAEIAREMAAVRDDSRKILGSFSAEIDASAEELKKFAANLSRTATRLENKTLPAIEGFEKRLTRIEPVPMTSIKFPAEMTAVEITQSSFDLLDPPDPKLNVDA